LRWPDRRFRGRRLLGAGCLPGWDHARQQDVLIFVASGRYSHMTLGVGHVGIIVGTTSHFRFGENPLGMKLGLHGFGDGICGFVLGLHTHKKV
jgi:hypothetical protein